MARDASGTPVAAPLFADLPDGRRMAVTPADAEVLAAVGTWTCRGWWGRR